MSNVRPRDLSREQWQTIHKECVAEFRLCCGSPVGESSAGDPWPLEETIKIVCLYSAGASVSERWP